MLDLHEIMPEELESHFELIFQLRGEAEWSSLAAVDTFCEDLIWTWQSCYFSVELWMSCMLLLCCDRDVAVRNSGAAAEVIAFTAAHLLLDVAKNNPAPQDKEDRMEGGVFPFPPLLSLYRSLSSLTKSNLFSPSFIIYTLTVFPPIFSPSVSRQRFSTSKALAPVKTPVTMQAQLTASARVAKTSRAFQQLSTGSKNRALFLLGVLGVGVWSCHPCKTTARFLLCTGKRGTVSAEWS